MLKRVANESLPYHIAVKDIPSVNDKGEACVINGIKMELFVFDSFPFSTKLVAFAVTHSNLIYKYVVLVIILS
jgi:UDP-N-acetylglucosamine pyrophosphorylase